MGQAIERVAALWDDVIEGFLVGECRFPPPLDRWLLAYRGTGQGRVDLTAIPEPYLGDLFGASPKAVFLALNPGPRDHRLQARAGTFAGEIRRLGSYRAWAATWPYLIAGGAGEAGNGPNRHHRARLQFLRRWYLDEDLSPSTMAAFELYPWHSQRLTGLIKPDPQIIREFVFDPIAELGNPTIFAFGAPWFEILEEIGVEVIERLGKGGRAYPTKVTNRSVLVGRTPEGSIVVAEKHTGGAGPPSEEEVRLLRAALGL
jgi:hypothetical protein